MLSPGGKVNVVVTSPPATPHSAGGVSMQDRKTDLRDEYKHVGVVSPDSQLLSENIEFFGKLRKNRWRLLDWILGTLAGQFFFLFLGALALLGLGGLVWALAGGNETWDQSFWQSMWFSWGMFFDPGTQMGIASQEPAKVKIIAVLFSVAGFTFNLLMLGLVVDKTRDLLEYWRRKRSRIVANGHTLLLGWTEKSLFIMEEIIHSAQNLSNRRPHLVILAEQDPFDVEQWINRHFSKQKAATIEVRQGAPCDIEDLVRVSTSSAKEIIILSPAEAPRRADLATLRTVVALAALEPGVQGNVVAEVRQAETSPCISQLLSKAEGVFARDAVNRVLSLMTVQPVVGDIYRQLMSWSDGVELYSKHISNLKMSSCKTYGDVIGGVAGGIVVGLRKPREHALMTPHPSTPVSQDDHILVLAFTDKDIIRHDKSSRRLSGLTTGPTFMQSEGNYRAAGSCNEDERLVISQEFIAVTEKPVFIIVGWPDDMEELLVGFDDYAKPGSEVHILARVPEEARLQRLRNNRASRNLKNIRLVHKQGSLSGLHSLADLPLHKACSILILADDTGGEDAETADTSSLATAISLNGLLNGKFPRVWNPAIMAPDMNEETRPHIVCEVLTPVLERVLSQHHLHKAVTFFHSCAVETGLFTMASAQASVYNSLLMMLQPNDFGQIQLRRMETYNSDGALSFAELQTKVQQKGDTLLGFSVRGGKPVVNPLDNSISVDAAARLIVLTTTLVEDAPKTVREMVKGAVGEAVETVTDATAVAKERVGEAVSAAKQQLRDQVPESEAEMMSAANPPATMSIPDVQMASRPPAMNSMPSADSLKGKPGLCSAFCQP